MHKEAGRLQQDNSGYDAIVARLADRRETVRSSLRRMAVSAKSVKATPREVLSVGGEDLRSARAALKASRETLAAYRSKQEALSIRLSGIPFVPGILARLSEGKTAALESVAAALAVEYDRSGGDAVRAANAAAKRRYLEENGERISRLREGIGYLDDLVERVRQIETDGHMAPLVPDGPGWLVRLDRQVSDIEMLYEPVSGGTVVNDGKDHSGLDLSPRSKVIPMLRRKAAFSERPWMECPVDDRPTMLAANRLTGGLAGFRLLGRSPAKEPRGLFDIRERRAIPMLPGSYSRADRLYLPVGIDRIDEAVAAGATLGRNGGFHIDPSTVPCDGPISAFLPFVAKRWYRPLQVEAIPSTSWGASLANLLTSSSWSEIRKAATSRFGGLCQTCGQLKNGSRIECHEIWDYDMDMEAGYGMKVQRLAGLMSVCKACHGVFHQGFSAMRGHGDQAEYRLADINGWSMAELETANVFMKANYEERSKVRWALDLSLVAGGKPLVIDAARWSPRPDGTIVGVGPTGKRSVTRVLGTDYKFGAKGEVVKASGSLQAA